MKKRALSFILAIALVSLILPSCGGGSESASSVNSEYSYEGSDEYSEGLEFNNSRDVYNYINGKTFSGDGMSVRFYNNWQSVDVNGTNIANNIKVYGIGVNDNGVAYATIQISSPAGITTTFSLLAVDGHAQLIDPNDGSVYEY